jgi:hypothetical protein
MNDLDTLIEEASTVKNWYAYGILFGKHKTSNDKPFATVIVSVYINKYTAMQRKFEAPTLSMVIEEVKKWIGNPDYVQLTAMPSKGLAKKENVKEKTLFS